MFVRTVKGSPRRMVITPFAPPRPAKMPSRRLVFMFSRAMVGLCLGIAALLSIALVSLVVTIQSMLPFRHGQAWQLWSQQRVAHYEVEVEWKTTWSSGHVLAEIQDNRIVGGVDLDTGESLVPLRLESAGYGANYFMVVDNLFGLIKAQTQPVTNWRTQVARYNPLLARFLDSCAAPLPRVHYNEAFGYPASIHFRGNPCHAQGEGTVLITQFRPLN